MNRRTAILLTTLMLAFTVGAGSAAAHNPGCHMPGHATGPHYAGGEASDTAYVHNPNLDSPDNADSLHPDHANSIHNREGSCSVGTSDD